MVWGALAKFGFNALKGGAKDLIKDGAKDGAKDALKKGAKEAFEKGALDLGGNLGPAVKKLGLDGLKNALTGAVKGDKDSISTLKGLFSGVNFHRQALKQVADLIFPGGGWFAKHAVDLGDKLGLPGLSAFTKNSKKPEPDIIKDTPPLSPPPTTI